MNSAHRTYTLFVLALALASAESRVALVIGNGQYEHSRKLVNPPNDGAAMAAKLRAAGFTVTELYHAEHEKMEAALKTFSQGLTPSTTALIFYAGHGVQVNGVSYLLPVDAKADDEATLKYEAVALDMVLDVLDRQGQGAGLKVLILDCCRDNPYGRNWGNRNTAGGTGLAAPTSTPAGTVLCFATDPGRVAKDGVGAANSPYTSGLLKHLFTPGLDIDLALRRAGAEVQEATNKTQNPWRNSNFNGEFAFVRGGAEPPMVQANPLDAGAVGKEVAYQLPGGVELRLCYIPPGQFTMGSPAEEAERYEDEDQVKVTISRGFWMAKYECTQGQWQGLMGSKPSGVPGSELPVATVSWEDAQRFITELNAKAELPAGWVWALPTEAQWEYACRAGTTTPFHFGGTLNGKEANCAGNYPYGTASKGPYLAKTVKVGSYAPNGWGLWDMHGNVWEWCADWYGDKLLGGTDPTGPGTGSNRVSRGGSWRSIAHFCRAACRERYAATFQFDGLGFRPAAVPAVAR